MDVEKAAPPAQDELRRDVILIAVVAFAHGASHFGQILLPTLYPFLTDAFNVTYVELGFISSVFFVVSCATQMSSGFLVDRIGPRPILAGALVLLIIGMIGYSVSTQYAMLGFFAVVSGLGNGVFHPVDFTIINRTIKPPRLGHAYSAHGISGNVGWAVAPALVAPIAVNYSWRTALLASAIYPALALILLLVFWKQLAGEAVAPKPGAAAGATGGGAFEFLKIPAVWACFSFFFFTATALTAVQVYAPESAREMNGLTIEDSAFSVTTYMLCAALGLFIGGFLAKKPERAERVVALGFVVACFAALVLAFASVPAFGVFFLFGVMGVSSGIAGPSRDLLVKASTPAGSGRVYGIVYSGLDIGQAIAPLIYGELLDAKNYRGVLIVLAVFQLALIATAFMVPRASRTPMGAAPPAPASGDGGDKAVAAAGVADETELPAYATLEEEPEADVEKVEEPVSQPVAAADTIVVVRKEEVV